MIMQKGFMSPFRKAGFFLIGAMLLMSCEEQNAWLDKKRRNSDVIPASLAQLQAMLDNTYVMNKNYGQLALLGSDNVSISEANLNAITQYERNAYLWQKDIFQGEPSYDWQYAYEMVAYANIVLETVERIEITASNSPTYGNVKGSALFYRSMAFYQLAQVFCKPFNQATASSDLGIPLRLSSDVALPSVRGTVQQVYDQIVNDLKIAIDLLPDIPQYTTRPSGVAAHALLAKVYLSMEQYDSALIHAERALQGKNALLDFNSSLVSETSTYRFPAFDVGNPEVVFYAQVVNYGSLGPSPSGRGHVPEELYEQYEEGDLRRNLFFQRNSDGAIKFQGNYTGTSRNFGGIATNELYLIRAECNARLGNTDAAMADLNILLANRYSNSSSFAGLTANNPEEALALILSERRKELPYTAQLRWEDLRRLNKDARFATTLQRTSNHNTFVLFPQDKRYVFPIPEIEIQLFNMPQNER